MRTAVFAGTFDPFTYGHLDVYTRACRLFDRVIIAVADSVSKSSMFSLEDRIGIVRLSVPKDAEIMRFSGLLTDFMAKESAEFIVRGVRNSLDYIYEAELEKAYKAITPSVECVYIFSSASFISGSYVREMIMLGASLTGLVHPDAANLIKSLKIKSNKT